MLRSLEIQNFKGIKQAKIDELAQVNILVGRNNSGKSTLLDVLLLMRCPWVRIDYLNVDGFQQIHERRVRRERVNPRLALRLMWAMMTTNISAAQ